MLVTIGITSNEDGNVKTRLLVRVLPSLYPPGLVGMSYGFFLSTVCSTTADAMKLAIRSHISKITFVFILLRFIYYITISLSLLHLHQVSYQQDNFCHKNHHHCSSKIIFVFILTRFIIVFQAPSSRRSCSVALSGHSRECPTRG